MVSGHQEALTDNEDGQNLNSKLNASFDYGQAINGDKDGTCEANYNFTQVPVLTSEETKIQQPPATPQEEEAKDDNIVIENS